MRFSSVPCFHSQFLISSQSTTWIWENLSSRELIKNLSSRIWEPQFPRLRRIWENLSSRELIKNLSSRFSSRNREPQFPRLRRNWQSRTSVPENFANEWSAIIISSRKLTIFWGEIVTENLSSRFSSLMRTSVPGSVPEFGNLSSRIFHQFPNSGTSVPELIINHQFPHHRSGAYSDSWTTQPHSDATYEQ